MTFETDFNELLLIVSSLAMVFGISRYAIHFVSDRRGLAKPNYSLLNLSGFVLVIGFILYLALNWWSHQSYPQSGQRYMVTNFSAFVGVLSLYLGFNANRFVEKPIRLLTWAITIAVIVGTLYLGMAWVVYNAYK